MKQEYTITIYTEDRVGMVGRLANIFSRRKINIEYLNAAPSEVQGIHRFTIVIQETHEVVQKLVRQIEKQVDVMKAYFHTEDEIVWQEMALYKVPSESITEKIKVERLLHEYGARAIAIRKDYIVFEATGHREEVNKLIKFFEPYGLIEFVRGARVAIIKNSTGFHEKVKEFERRQPAENFEINSIQEDQSVFSL